MSTETSSSDRRSRTRVPRGARRREEIAAVAERVFLERGLSNTTMKMVAAEAGASTETLYRHFGGKDDLFMEIVSSRTQEFRRRIDMDLESAGPLPDVLKALGMNLYEAMTRPEMSALARIVVAEVPRNPALGEAFYAMAPGRTLQKLISYLQDAKARGAFTGDDPVLAANMFIGLIMGKVIAVRLFIPHLDTSSHADRADHVGEAIRFFLAVYRPQIP